MDLNKIYKNVCRDVLNNGSLKHDLDSAILALHESATKIWQAKENNQNEKINLRVASALISIFYIMNEMGVEDPEELLRKKMEELEDL